MQKTTTQNILLDHISLESLYVNSKTDSNVCSAQQKQLYQQSLYHLPNEHPSNNVATMPVKNNTQKCVPASSAAKRSFASSLRRPRVTFCTPFSMVGVVADTDLHKQKTADQSGKFKNEKCLEGGDVAASSEGAVEAQDWTTSGRKVSEGLIKTFKNSKYRTQTKC